MLPATPLSTAIILHLQIHELANFTADPNPNVTRLIFSEEDMRARAYIKDLMSTAGLTVRCCPSKFCAQSMCLLLFHRLTTRGHILYRNLLFWIWCREDEMGNIYGRLEGTDRSKGAVSSGSHCDAIPLAGMYDGTLGVLGPIMAIKAIRDAVRAPELRCMPKWPAA